jgi:XRE family transcriptional regulator, regulator of sulfur utilization
MAMNKLAKLQVRQLDDALMLFSSLRTVPIPRDGWIKAVRETLGMSIRQLAERTGLSKTSVTSIESSERKGSVQVNSIRRLAEGMDCELVYVLLPRQSLEEGLKNQAEQKARRLVDRVSTSMEMEFQGIAESERERQINDLAAELLRTRKRDFWDV